MSYIDLAIDLGTSFVSIYKKGSGLVLKEPAMVCVTTGAKANTVKQIGLDAKKLQGKTGSGTVIVSPISEGIVKNVELAASMLKHFLSKVKGSALKQKIKAVVTFPCGITADELRDLERVVYSAGISEAFFVPSLVCAALGDKLRSIKSSVVVNIGGGKTEVGVLNGVTVINGCSIGVGGKLMDLSVIDYVEENYNIVISDVMAEKVRKETGSLYETDKSSVEFSGTDISSNRVVSDIITALDIKSAVKYFYDKIIEAVIVTINGCLPDIVTDITETGILVSGGAAEIAGLDNYFTKKLNLPVKIAEQFGNAVIIGAGALLNDEALLKQVLSEN